MLYGEDLRLRCKLDLTEGFLDATFAEAKKGTTKSVRRDGQRQQDHGGLRRPWSSSRRPRGQRFARGNRLVDATLPDRFLAAFPERLIGDRGYDSVRSTGTCFRPSGSN